MTFLNIKVSVTLHAISEPKSFYIFSRCLVLSIFFSYFNFLKMVQPIWVLFIQLFNETNSVTCLVPGWALAAVPVTRGKARSMFILIESQNHIILLSWT